MKGGDFKQMLLNKAMSFGQNIVKNKICSGDVESIKTNAIKALQMMPASAVSKLIQQSPLCTGQGSLSSMSSMVGGKKQKTRKQKRKQRKTRKH